MKDGADFGHDFSEQPKFVGGLPPEYGLVMNMYTIAELKDLIAAKDAEVKHLADTASIFLPKWRSKDVTAAGVWESDYNVFSGKYKAARKTAQDTIDGASSLIPESMNPADDEYRGLLSAMNPMWTQNTWGPGSIEDLSDRITKAGAVQKPYTVPQPRKGTDFDLNTMNSLPDVTKIPGVAWDFFKEHKVILVAIGFVVVAILVIPPLIPVFTTVGAARRMLPI
jgi:hypothetical protein